MLFAKPRKLSLVSTILWKKRKIESVTDQAIYFDFCARKCEGQKKCGAFSKSFIIYLWNYGCLVRIFSIFFLVNFATVSVFGILRG